MKEPKNNAHVELVKDAAGYWLVVNGARVFVGQLRPGLEGLKELGKRGPVMMTRDARGSS